MIIIQDLSRCYRLFGCIAFSFLCLFATTAVSQDQNGADEKLSAGQIEQLVAPIALHPDSLLSQILMASTYPLEMVQAARWRGTNSDIEGAALEDALEAKDWDASVKSLTAFPDVLKMMNDDLAWTQQLGDAFLAQQEDVLAAVQSLRRRAKEENTLVTTEQQIVKVEQPPADNDSQETVIVIEPRDPEVVYVPAYDPKVVYGTWPYPSYPPYNWYPSGYVAGNALWFGAGVVAGGALWGGCDWWRRSVDINVNRYNSFNRTRIDSRRWRHNPRHRRAVPYRNRRVSSRYRRSTSDRRARQRYRGHADAGRRELRDNRPGRPGGERPGRPGGERPDRPGGERPG
ncbi:MAG: DUF3300 domain-containing protein, partial [Hyphomicrobiaceae bacterium]